MQPEIEYESMPNKPIFKIEDMHMAKHVLKMQHLTKIEMQRNDNKPHESILFGIPLSSPSKWVKEIESAE
jgi:hypothetical protein